MAACREADLDLQQHQQLHQRPSAAVGGGPLSSGGGNGSSGQQAGAASGAVLAVLEQERTETAREFQLYVCEVLQQL